MSEVPKFKNFINGEWLEPSTGDYFANVNPADMDDIIGLFPLSASEDVDRAVQAGRNAFREWSLTPPPGRGEIISNAERLLKRHKEELARIETREMGKVLTESRGDVQEGIDTAFYMAGEGRRLYGDTTTSELRNKFCMAIRRPIGMAGLITPWNFPLAIPAWKIFPALICGNTIVFKPASDAPHTALRFVEILTEAGVPRGVINLVFGGGGSVGMSLVDHPGVDVVSFTGSSEVGSKIAEVCGRHLKRLSLEMGGKNGQIVMEDADVDLAVDGALWGAFGTTGQRCTATSRIIVMREVHDEFAEKLAGKAEGLRLGNGMSEGVEVGPLINSDQLKKVEYYVKVGLEEDGATLLTGGRRAAGPELEKGWFFEPTIFTGCTPEMRISQEEIFGPVLSIISVNSFEEAVEAINSTSYGLSSSIYTRDVNRAMKAVELINAGITYINSPTIGAECHLPFGGTRRTGNGHRESGHWVLDTFSEWKAVYFDYSGRLQKAQIDTE